MEKIETVSLTDLVRQADLISDDTARHGEPPTPDGS